MRLWVIAMIGVAIPLLFLTSCSVSEERQQKIQAKAGQEAYDAVYAKTLELELEAGKEPAEAELIAHRAGEDARIAAEEAVRVAFKAEGQSGIDWGGLGTSILSVLSTLGLGMLRKNA